MTGDTKGLSVYRLIHPTILTDATELEISRMEWAWGLERGGLDYYLRSPPNDIFFRSDIADMYADGEFVLLPTHQTYMKAMDFSRRAGFLERDENDCSPRRPLTALRPSNGVYRYVFIPITPAARDIPHQIAMKRQTDADWNGGVHPATGKPLPPWVKDYLVVETHSHPVSICKFAREILDTVNRGPIDLTPWTSCLWRFEKQWGLGDISPIKPPQWFIDDAEKDHDDENLSESEAIGYWPLACGKDDFHDRVPGYATSSSTDDSQGSTRVLQWLETVPRRKARPVRASRKRPAVLPPQTPRRSQRIASKLSNVQPSPARRPDSVESNKSIPGWLEQNGHFPTHMFTSNDWAMFCYGTQLSQDDVENVC
ncbi:hypothetical protein BD626DRAFT_573310 [Schizophyllum amplum]|uniref:Uncharacterized protein n=1 Tax=Schizophyllum amplum TaxID=97359 RepID=A0A550C1X5_9AGAR|nr:hypothetical protein BD626DRAFT_573310 [Auriculariopsis ampla]